MLTPRTQTKTTTTHPKKKLGGPILAIIPAAGTPTNKIIPHRHLPDTMLPINGKPVIGHIIDDLIGRGITDIALVLHKEDNHTEHYAKRMYGGKCLLTVLYNKNPELGIGHSIATSALQNNEAESILVYLGDTLYKGALSFDKDFIVVADPISESSKWCFVEKTGKNHLFINKPTHYEGNGKILCGVYFFRDADTLRSLLMHATDREQKTELADILTQYVKENPLSLVPAQHWFDCGNVENYHRAKIHFLKTREFNTITYDDTYGTITKTGRNKKKIADEIKWYKTIPGDLAIFAPRLVNASLTARSTSYTTEFYGYQTLADLLMFESLDIKFWETIIKKLFVTLSLFKKHTGTVPFTYYEDMYLTKTISRLEELKNSASWKDLMEIETLTINGKRHHNIAFFLPRIKKALKKLYQKKEISFIHGDFFLGNILYDPSSNILKCIDPRGSFGKTSSFGDHKYDVAKLRHSFHGLYDYIVSDLFSVEGNGNTWNLKFFTSPELEDVRHYFDRELAANKFDLFSVGLIEALLFLSMPPLHKDNPKRQLAMYLRGIELINNLEWN